jgi:dihydrofolate reductase
MRQLIVTEFVSLDGVMEAPGGEPGYAHTGWVSDFFSDELGRYKLQEQLGTDTLLLGRKTYESFAGAWPHRAGEFADKVNGMQKLVVSSTLQRAEWNNSTVLPSLTTEAVAGLKRQDGAPILVAGSRTLVHWLMQEDLVDEYHLQVFPLILGSGARLYPETPAKTALQLIGSETLASGVVLQSYRPAA